MQETGATMDSSTILTLIGVAVVVIPLMGAAVAYFKGSLDSGIKARQEYNINTLEKSVELLEKAVAENAQLIANLKSENTRLTTMVTARDLIEHLQDELHAHRTSLLESLASMQAELTAIRAAQERGR